MRICLKYEFTSSLRNVSDCNLPDRENAAMLSGHNMALSQCLEDSPGWRTPKGRQDLNLKELYNERHRLALEELVAGGVDSYMGFLKKEKIPNFLSDYEIRQISRSAVLPRCVSLIGEDALLEHSSSTMDCSSVTYFPEVSDIEPPVLENGWPAFTTGSYRGVTRAIAHFQPSYGECIYSCKEAARRMIKSAKEVIAIVTDSLTDLDIFQDLQEACIRRRVPVYILLDQATVPSFLQMCSSLNVRLDELQKMRVRTITGATYYMRSGTRLTGQVHERFMLIDGNKVATGSYRFNWADGKLNSSNLIELSGQIAENFDEEFRILYAQSLPLNTARCPPGARTSGIYDHLLLLPPATPPAQFPRTTVPDGACLTSTPSRAQSRGVLQPSDETEEKSQRSRPMSDTSTLGEDWVEQEALRQEVLACDADLCLPKADASTDPPALATAPLPALPPRHMSTQTSRATVDSSVQTDLEPSLRQASTPTSASSSPCASSDSASASTPPKHDSAPQGAERRPPIRRGFVPPDGNLRDCFRKLTKERQYHYSTIRSKLDQMVTLISRRRELVDLTNLALGPGLHRGLKVLQNQQGVGWRMENAGLMGTWPRTRCLQ